jgi:hypothetical protein
MSHLVPYIYEVYCGLLLLPRPLRRPESILSALLNEATQWQGSPHPSLHRPTSSQSESWKYRSQMTGPFSADSRDPPSRWPWACILFLDRFILFEKASPHSNILKLGLLTNGGMLCEKDDPSRMPKDGNMRTIYRYASVSVKVSREPNHETAYVQGFTRNIVPLTTKLPSGHKPNQLGGFHGQGTFVHFPTLCTWADSLMQSSPHQSCGPDARHSTTP